jgi:hypothetical protein
MIFASVILHVSAGAQTRERMALGVVAGPFQYDLSLSATGTSAFAALRLDVPLARYVLLEPGVTFSRYDPQLSGSKVTLLFPEIQIQLRGTSPSVSPYLGVGAGPAFAIRAGATETELSLTGAAGLRVRLTSDWGARGELRVRAIGPFGAMTCSFGSTCGSTDTTAELGIGVSRRL